MMRRRLAATAVVLATFGMNAATLGVMLATDFLSRFVRPGITEFDQAIVYVTIAGFCAVTMSYVVVGMVLSDRQGAGRIATVLLVGGALFAATPFGYSVGAQMTYLAPQSALANALFLVGPLAVGPAFVLILPGLALVFPTGRFPSDRWNVPVTLVAAMMGVGTMLQLVHPGAIADGTQSHNPFGIDALPAGLEETSGLLVAAGVLGAMILGLTAVIVRNRSADATMRQQLRWFIVAVLLAAVPLPISIIPAVGGPQWGALACIGLLLVPVSVWIAVTRYRLYEIDRLISRTIGWALVTGVLGAVFVGTVVGLQAILDQVMQGQTLAVAASTLVAFALFQPIRRRVQTAVDHRFDRARYDGERTATAFADRRRDQVDLAELEADIAGTVDAALRPRSFGLWIRSGPGSTR
jgi:hypothetical protein